MQIFAILATDCDWPELQDVQDAQRSAVLDCPHGSFLHHDPWYVPPKFLHTESALLILTNCKTNLDKLQYICYGLRISFLYAFLSCGPALLYEPCTVWHAVVSIVSDALPASNTLKTTDPLAYPQYPLIHRIVELSIQSFERRTGKTTQQPFRCDSSIWIWDLLGNTAHHRTMRAVMCSCYIVIWV